MSGNNGGYPQTFQISYSETDGSNFNKSTILDDPGVGETLHYTIMDLKENKQYMCKVVTTNTNPNRLKNTAESGLQQFKTYGKIFNSYILKKRIYYHY